MIGILLTTLFAGLLTAIPDVSPGREQVFPANTVTADRLALLKRQRAALLETPQESVTFHKKIPAPSKSPHDYVSVGMYWWPDPTKHDGLPYVNRDGVVNPDAQNGDYAKLSRLRSALIPLALLAATTDDRELGRHGARLLRTFFIDPATAMTPHMRYAQGVPGRVTGRATGTIDSYALVEIADAAVILYRAKMLPEDDFRALQKWFRAYRDWLESPDIAGSLADSAANIGLAYHTQIIAFSLFADDVDKASRQAEKFKRQLSAAVAADGFMPHEMRRTKSFDYSVYALNIALSGIAAAHNAGNLLLARDSDAGKAMRRAVDKLSSFISQPGAWPGKQLGAVHPDLLGNILLRMYHLTGEKKYLAAFRQLKNPSISHLNAFYYPPPAHRLSGAVFRWDKSPEHFVLITPTQYDPQGAEGPSRFDLSWNGKTEFIRREAAGTPEGRAPARLKIMPEQQKLLRQSKAFTVAELTILATRGEREGGPDMFYGDVSDFSTGKRLRGKFDFDNRPHSFFVAPGSAWRETAGSAAELRNRAAGADVTLGPNGVATRIVYTLRPDIRDGETIGLKRVLSIGDSISMDYYGVVKERLHGKANFHRIDGNGGDTRRGIAQLELWLGDTDEPGNRWDIVILNHGLHDLRRPGNAEKRIFGEKNQVSPREYALNLEKILRKLTAQKIKVIWCTTTPVPNDSFGPYGRRRAEDIEYNRIAAEVLRKFPEIHVCDLNKEVQDNAAFDRWRQGSNVHFGPEENKILGNAVAAAVQLFL